MEQQLNSSLERIDNPILVILLIVLMVANVALFINYRGLQKQFVELIVQNVGALKDINSTLEGIRDAGVNHTADLRDRIDQVRNTIVDRINTLQK